MTIPGKDYPGGGWLTRVAVVAIGRNEGERLRRCLDSVTRLSGRVVYVDSGSTDQSVAVARGMGVMVLELEMSSPFTAARARNEGFWRLLERVPDVSYVQFLDGDCELAGRWLEEAAQFLDEHEGVAAVCGRLREKFPKRSVYNLLCDIEWDAPTGETKACGGNVMMRVRAFKDVKGFRAGLIAGEEPELCVRLRAAGWHIWRLSKEMAWHDAAMTRFGQWWRRTLRGGYTYAQGVHLHGAPPERHCVRESRSVWFWGMGVPLGQLCLYLWLGPWALVALLVYPLQVVRLATHANRSSRARWRRAVFLVLGKFPEMLGQIKFWYHHYIGAPPGLIEHK